MQLKHKKHLSLLIGAIVLAALVTGGLYWWTSGAPEETFVWAEPTGEFVMNPRIDITTTDLMHLRWVPTIEDVCLDNWYLLFEKTGDSIKIPRGTPPLARAQATCRPTDGGYECIGDITGITQPGKSYLFQTTSDQCGDNQDRVSPIQEYFSAPLEIETEPVEGQIAP